MGVIYEIDLTSTPYEIYQQKKYYDNGGHPKWDSLFYHYDSIAFRFSKPFIPNDEKIKLGIVNDSLVTELVDRINNPKNMNAISKVFNYYRIDSSWLMIHRDSLLNIWVSRRKNKKKSEKEFAQSVLSNYSQFKKLAYYKILKHITSHYPEVYISFESESDSTILFNEGQYSFLLPWKIDTAYVNYDPMISLIIGQLLPEQDFIINKKYLNPTKEEFVGEIMDELVHRSLFVRKK